MPKVKTKRSAAKRLKRSASGKLRRRAGWKRHLLEAKPPKRKRRLRRPKPISAADQPRLERLVPYL
jgi:large subunit ribosomal protein L35